MMKKIITLLFLGAVTFSFGQSYISVYNFNHINQNLLVNPASPHNYKLVIGIPGLGGLSTHINNKNLGSFLEEGGDPNENLGSTINNLQPKDRINTTQSLDGIFVGFATGRGYWTVTAQQKTDFNMTVPSELMKFLYFGNAGSGYVGKSLDLNTFNIEAIVRNEYGIGYQHKVDSNLIIGGRFKYISGVSNIYTQRFNTSIYSDIENINVNTDILINTAGIYNGILDSENPLGYYSGGAFSKNIGMSLDLGAYYRINERFDISGSILNIGWVKWRKDLRGIELKGDFDFYGVETGFPFDSLDFGEFIDSTVSRIEVNEIDINSYSTSLPSHFIISGQFYASEKHVFGALYQGSIWNNTLYSNYGVMYNGRYSKWFNLMLGYSVIDNSLNNMTLGASVRLGPFQIYALTDNTFGFLSPSKIVATNVRAGISLSFLDTPKKLKSKKSKSKNE